MMMNYESKKKKMSTVILLACMTHFPSLDENVVSVRFSALLNLKQLRFMTEKPT